VTVKPAGKAAPAPARTVEPFALGRVVLTQDSQGRDTPFIRNRDKFIKGLASTNPDSFLYNFRDAFGQPQPRARCSSPDGTTRRRGCAATRAATTCPRVAQAYAGTTYDEALRPASCRR